MKKGFSFPSMIATEYQKLSRFYVPVMAGGILSVLTGYTIPCSFIFLLLAILAVIGFYKRFRTIRPIVWIIALFLLGMIITEFRIQTVKSPALDHPIYDADIRGRVIKSSAILNKQTIIIDDIALLNNQDTIVPERLKLTYQGTDPLLIKGDIIRAKARLRTPQKSLFPGSYDEAEQLYFDNIGGIGIIHQILSRQSESSPTSIRLEQIRTHIANRIHQLLPNEIAQIAIPLTIGDQKVISQHLYDIFRSAGITHILSVSGFHLSLLAAFVFFFIRKLLSLYPAFAERFSTKKLAAVIALLCTAGYIAISGMQVPAIWSFIMIAVVLIAILFDRDAFSVRSWSIAAFLLLIYRPELILNIGFQLSFLAVLVLVTLYPILRDKIYMRKTDSFLYHLLSLIACFILLDFLITLITMPYILYHFNRYTLYGSLGNILTGTLLSFWIMPLLFVAMVFIPIGFDSIFFKGAAIALEYIIAVCEQINTLPYATLFSSSFSAESLIVITIGILLLCLMTTRLRLIGLFIMGIGILLAVYSPRPDILIGDKGLTIAVRENGKLQFISKAPTDFTAKIWLLHNGEDPKNITISEKPPFLFIRGKKIALDEEACIGADLCLLPVPHPRQPNAISLYDKNVRAIYIRKNRIQIKIP